jgi:hypothetical protein
MITHYSSSANEVTVECNRCKKEQTIGGITLAKLKHYQDGELIQNVLPELSPDQRELLISGICGKCFDEMFADED